MAFQANAFQSNAFQISASQAQEIDIALQRRRKRRLEEVELRDEYLRVKEFLKEIKPQVKGFEDVDRYEQKIDSIIAPLKRDGILDIQLIQVQEKDRLEQILASIRRLEDELLEMLALLLLANEAL